MPDLLRAFTSGGFTIQAPPARVAFGLVALVALTGGMQRSPAPLSGVSGTMPEGAYARLVQAMQERSDVETGYGRIVFVDRSASPEDEAARLASVLPGRRVAPAVLGLPGERAASRRLALVDDDQAYRGRGYEIPDGSTCLVAGPPAGATVEEVAGPDAVDAGVTALEAFRYAIWREVGHCLLPENDAAAEAFAGLAAVRRHGDGRLARAMAERPSDGDGVDPRVEAALLAVAGLGPAEREALADKGWGGLAAMADRMAGPVPSPVPLARPEPQATASVASPAHVPHPAVDDEDEQDEAPRPR